MPTADREGLREELAAAQALQSALRTVEGFAYSFEQRIVFLTIARGQNFDAPLHLMRLCQALGNAPDLAQADTAAQAVAERVEAVEVRDPQEVTVEMIAAAWAVVRDRYPNGRVLGPGPGFREAIAAAVALRPPCDLEARIVEAETNAEVDREFAETSRLREVAALARATAAEAENEGLRAALDDTRAAADDLAAVCLDEGDNKTAGTLQFVSGFISDQLAALAQAGKADSAEGERR